MLICYYVLFFCYYVFNHYSVLLVNLKRYSVGMVEDKKNFDI